jgi:hypothetical protein
MKKLNAIAIAQMIVFPVCAVMAIWSSNPWLFAKIAITNAIVLMTWVFVYINFIRKP